MGVEKISSDESKVLKRKKLKKDECCGLSIVLKFYIWFGVLLELAINFYFVKFHEVGAFEPIQYIQN